MAKGAVQNLTTWLNINAKTNGFTQVGDTLTQMGELVMTVGNQVIDYGKKSIGVYQNYQDNMLAAEGALAAKYGRDSAELKAVMEELDTAARQWASSTIFHTDDVSNAIFEVAQAGWSLEEILSGIPAAMKLAQAGGLDLSQGLEYIISTVNAADIDLDDLGNWIDVWAFAANSSAATISDFGEAMEKMGSTMKFAGSQEELVTLLAMLHNNGTKGAAAGTLLRNSMIRLIAPTKKASDVMGTLNLTEAELEDILSESNGDLDAAAEALEKVGFSAYDKDGNLKSFLEIFTELDVALKGMREEERNNILASIFPTRTITGAMNLLDAAASGFDGLYTAMMAGDAEGYGEYLSELMMSGVTGTIETVKSKFEELERRAGAAAFAEIEGVIGWVEGILNDLNAMDDDKFQGLVSGLVAIAEVGTGLTLAGSALTILGKVLTPGGVVAAGLAAVAFAAGELIELSKTDVGDLGFGDMGVNMEGVRTYIHTIGEDFDYTHQQISTFRSQLSEAVTDYTEASSRLSSTLFESILTEATLTEDDIENLYSLGSQMQLALVSGISNRNAMSVTFWTELFGGEGVAENNPYYQNIIELINEDYEDSVEYAKSIGQDLRDALFAAWVDDQKISDDEYGAILAVMRDMNDAMARAASEVASEEAYVNLSKTLGKAQNASIEDFTAIADEIMTQRDEELKRREDEFWTEYYKQEYRGEDEETLAETKRLFFESQERKRQEYNDNLYKLFDVYLETYGLEYLDEIYAEKAQNFLSGEVTGSELEYYELLKGRLNKDDEKLFNDMSKYIQLTRLFAKAFTGVDSKWDDMDDYGAAWVQSINALYTTGQYDEATKQLGFLAKILIPDLRGFRYEEGGFGYNPDDPYMDQLIEYVANGVDASPSLGLSVRDPENDSFTVIKYKDPGMGTAKSLYQRYGMSATTDQARSFIGEMESAFTDGLLAIMNGEATSIGEAFGTQELQELFWKTYNSLGKTYDFSLAGETLNKMGIPTSTSAGVMYELLYGALSGRSDLFKFDNAGLSMQFGEGDEIEIPTVIEPNDEKLIAVFADADGTPISVELIGNLSTLKAQIAVLRSQYGTLNVTLRGVPGYAEGGRATSASIFGEAGPEWAIPEEHSERTAALLNAARAASGFTWPDILARFGGLNASANHQPTTIVYSPIINAADTTGVDRVLREDKRRLDKWYEERMMRERVEVYA